MSASMSTNHEPGPVARAMADSRFDHLCNRRTRRRLSILNMVLGVAFMSFLAVGIPAGWPVWLVVSGSAGLMVGWILVMGALNRSINGLTELKDRDLDEIQRRIRDRAHRYAYRVAVGVVSVLALAIVSGLLNGTSATQNLLIASPAFLLVNNLPAHLLAWTLPEDAEA